MHDDDDLDNERKKREIINCPHKTKKHYAKNMCITCYHRRGRTKKAWNCPHSDKLHYSKGLCQNCYLALYYQKRKAKRIAKGLPPTEGEESLTEAFSLQKRLKTTCSESEITLLKKNGIIRNAESSAVEHAGESSPNSVEMRREEEEEAEQVEEEFKDQEGPELSKDLDLGVQGTIEDIILEETLGHGPVDGSRHGSRSSSSSRKSSRKSSHHSDNEIVQSG